MSLWDWLLAAWIYEELFDNDSDNTWDNIKHTNILIIGVPEGEDREKGTEKILEEITAENFPNFPIGKEIINQVREAQRNFLCRINPRRNTPRYIVIKLTKIKD